MGVVTSAGDVLDVTLSLDTSAYIAGDLLADTQEIPQAVARVGGRALLQSVVVLDEDDQKQGFDLVFLSANVSMGTENSTPSITDANARNIIGTVRIGAGDYIDMGGASVATLMGMGLQLKAGTSDTSLYLAAVSQGTGTYTASSLKLKLGVIWD